MKPLYSICVLCYNKSEMTKQCLEALFSTDLSRAEVIVINNASTDGTKDYLESLGDKIRAFTLAENIGIQGYNAGLPQARGNYFVTLNNDVMVGGDWLNMMRAPFLADPQMALVGAREAPCYLNNAGHGGTTVENGEPDYVEGSCMMALTAIVRKHGLFDPVYRLGYCEDADLSLRLRKIGYHIQHVNAPVKHLHTQTVPVAVADGIDMWGSHDINHHTLRRRWKGYLKTKSFVERILVRRAMAMGDVLLTTPVIHQLKKENAHAEIHVDTRYPEVFKDNPDVCSTSPSGAYHRAINFDQCYENTPNRHIVDSYAEAAGVKVTDYFPRIYPSAEDYQAAKDRFEDGKWAVVHSGPHRGINPVEGRTVTDKLMHDIKCHLEDRGYSIVNLDVLNLSLGYLSALIGKASLFVGADSGPMHIAQAMHTPTVGIFGAVNPFYRLVPGVPFLHGVSAWPRDCGCLGCHHLYEPPMLGSQCIRGGDDFNRCMKKVKAEDVFKAIDLVLEKKKMYLETSKIRELVLPFLVGKGIDVGCQRDPITPDCVAFDKNPGPEVTHVGDARNLGFSDGQFDWLWSSHCLEDLPDTLGALTEWCRVVRSGGVIALYVPHPELYKGGNADHVHPGFRAEELSEYLSQLNCHIIAAVNHDLAGPTHPCHSVLVIARKA
jgi:ADP-heptose:LPS heptosyltransferase